MTQHPSHHEKQRVLSEMFFPPCLGKHLFLITRKKKTSSTLHECPKSLKAISDSDIRLGAVYGWINLPGQWRVGQDLHSHILLPGERLVPVLPTMQHWNNFGFCYEEWSAHVRKLGLQDSEKKQWLQQQDILKVLAQQMCISVLLVLTYSQQAVFTGFRPKSVTFWQTKTLLDATSQSKNSTMRSPFFLLH